MRSKELFLWLFVVTLSLVSSSCHGLRLFGLPKSSCGSSSIQTKKTITMPFLHFRGGDSSSDDKDKGMGAQDDSDEYDEEETDAEDGVVVEVSLDISEDAVNDDGGESWEGVEDEGEETDLVDAEEEEEETTFATTEVVMMDGDDNDVDPEMTSTNDGDSSSAFVDRMELADAYDEGETTASSGFEVDRGGSGQVFDNDDNNDDEEEVVAEEEEEVVAEEEETVAVEEEGDSSGKEEAAPATAPADDDDDVAEETNMDPAVAEAASAPAAEDAEPISDEIKEILVQKLKYRPRDVMAMKPDVARIVAAKEMQKPIEGMPPSFYADPEVAAAVSSPAVKRFRLFSRIAITTTFMALTVRAGVRGSLPFSSILMRKKETVGVAATPSLVSSDTATATSAGDTETDAAEAEEEEEEEPQSVRPGQKTKPSEEWDSTWLDKIITAIGKGFKKFFGMKV